MSMRYKGGVISATPPTTSTTSAVGVWTLAQQLQAQGAGNWPTILSDQYFRYVTMLLHGDGTNGAQNNTFLDSSTNNFTITRNGNTTQGSFSPYGSNWSNYFGGVTGNYFVLPSSQTPLNLGSGDFTVECWVNLFDISQYALVLTVGFSSWQLGYDSSRKLYVYNGGNTMTSSTAVVANTWNHFAWTRSGSTMYLYLNGVQVATATNTSPVDLGGAYIGAYAGGTSSYQFYGYLSNLRIVKGTAVYTSAFTPSTTPLTAISGTSLLTCQSNRFIDSSTNNFAITVAGTPSVQRFSPFSPSSAYSTSTIGGSGYFDGSGDYLTAPSNAAFSFGTGDFTVEGWVYPNAVTGGNAKVIVDLRGGSYLNSQVAVAIYNGGWLINIGGTQVISGGVAVINQWSHFALVRSGTNLKLFINGVQTGSTYSDSNNYSSYGEYIGNLAGGLAGYETVGYISDIRILKGTALYTSAFTPPTAPLTAITNTSLLTNFTNGGIFDNAMMNNLETVGSAQISTSVFKYGTGSMSLSASGNTLRTQYNNPSLSMGTGDFTIEGWVYLSSTPSTNGVFQMSGTSGGFVNNQTANLALGTNSSSTWQIYAKNTYTISSSTTIPVGSWIHFALVRSGTTTVLYINGTALITLTADSTNYSTPYIGLGSIYDATSYPLGGYIDDLRITKGYARYTTTFTPPTAAFPNQ